MNRTERRAAAHKERKLARKAGFPTPAVAPPSTLEGIPEPGAPLPSLASITRTARPISPAQLNANRGNAQHSTGPTTSAGRATSSQNHTSHGLARHNGHFALLSTENGPAFDSLKKSLAGEHQPSTPTELILVNAMAESIWLADRAQHLQTSVTDPASGQITDPKAFSLYLRYQTTHTRAFHKSLNDLLKLRAETRKSENGFEAQQRKEEELRIKNEQHEMKKQKHYWEVLLKDAQTCHQMAANTTQQSKATVEDPGFKTQFAAELANHGLKNHSFGAATAA